MLRSFCDNVSDGRRGPTHLQDASNRQANDDESADEHTDCGQSTFAGETGFVHSRTEPSRRSSGSLLHAASRRPLRRPERHPQRLWLPAQLKQLVSCSKSGTNRNNCALSRRNWTGAKKRSVKSVRLICSMIHRLRAIAQDFAEFRKAGLTHPMMADIEKELGVSP